MLYKVSQNKGDSSFWISVIGKGAHIKKAADMLTKLVTTEEVQALLVFLTCWPMLEAKEVPQNLDSIESLA